MRILAVSDVEDSALGERFDAERWRREGIDFLISCGDLPATYLSDLVSLFNVPLLYVPGNHDGEYREAPPEGGDSIDGQLVVRDGLRILGLGGSSWYNGGPDQYREWQMWLRAERLKPRIWRAGGVDLIVTHAPPRFPPSASPHGSVAGQPIPDHVHRGFAVFADLIRAYRPRLFLHGHTHLGYGTLKRHVDFQGTQIVDAYGHVVLDV